MSDLGGEVEKICERIIGESQATKSLEKGEGEKESSAIHSIGKSKSEKPSLEPQAKGEEGKVSKGETFEKNKESPNISHTVSLHLSENPIISAVAYSPDNSVYDDSAISIR